MTYGVISRVLTIEALASRFPQIRTLYVRLANSLLEIYRSIVLSSFGKEYEIQELSFTVYCKTSPIFLSSQ